MTEWWADDPTIAKGIQIAADRKAKGGLFREVLAPLPCRQCTAEGRRARGILAVYAEAGGALWVWTAGHRSVVTGSTRTAERKPERIPPRAVPFVVPSLGVAVCQQCGHGQPYSIGKQGIMVGYAPVPPTRGRITE